MTELTEEQQAKLAELDAQLAQFEEQRRWSDVIKTIIAKAELVVDEDEKADLYGRAGALYIERSSNQSEAINCFEKVLELRPNDLETMARLKEAYEKRRDWEGLLGIMDKEAQMADEGDRAFLYLEMAELATKRIRKPEACIAMWEKVRSVEPNNPNAIEALSTLYDRAREYEKLAEVLEISVLADPDTKTLTKLGGIYADKIGDDEAAVRVFQRILELDPNDRRAQEQLKRRYVALKAWDELEGFYGQSGKWDELIRILEREADGKETEAEDRVALLFRAANLWITQNDRPERAARAYEKVLETDASNLQAAEALSQIYEEAGDARKLVKVYEVRLGHDMSDDERIALLRETGIRYEERLRQPEEAYAKYLEAFAVDPRQDVIREDVQRMAQAARDYNKLVTAYTTAIEEADEDTQIDLRMDLGGVLRATDQAEAAVAQFEAVSEVNPDHRGAIAALSELYAEAGNHAALRDVVERRIQLEDDEGVRRGLFYERARLLEEQLEDTDGAIAAYQDILGEFGPGEKDAFIALDRLFESSERYEELAGILERRMDLAPDSEEELAAIKFRLGRTLEQHLGREEEAVELYREVLMLMPEHEGATSALEALLAHESVGMTSARILEPVFEARGNWQMLIRVLGVLHDGSDDPDERLELMTKVAEIQGQNLGDGSASFEAYCNALRANPRSEDTLARLEMLAMSQESFPQLVEVLQSLAADADDEDLSRSLWIKAALIQETQLEDVDGAVAAYRKVLDLNPGDAEVLGSLDELFRRTERWSDLVNVLRTRVEQSDDPDAQEELLTQMAQVQDQFLEQPEAAISTHREVLQINPASTRALSELDGLFARQEMWAELADNVERQLELASEPEQQVELMLRSAQLRETRMDATDAAIEIYREVLYRQPDNDAATASLERLLENEAQQPVIAEILEPIYRDSGRVQKLIGIHEIQAKHAAAPDRKVDLLHRVAELYELQLDDYQGAFDAFSRALSEDPSNIRTQEELERLTPMLGDAEALAKTYEEQVADVEDPMLAASLHMKAARIRESQLGDHPAAIAHYQKVLEFDEAHREAAESLERLYQLGEQYENLAQIYLHKAAHAPNIDEQKEEMYRAGAIYEEILEQPEKAIAVYHATLEADPEDIRSLDKLIELNLGQGQWDELLAVYERKAETVFDADEKKRIYLEVGAVYEREKEDQAKAIDSYQRILEIDPDDEGALGRLDALYLATENWDELLSVLEREAELAGDPNEVMSFRYRTGRIWQQQNGDALRAVEIFRDVLELTPDHTPSLNALEEMIAADQEALAATNVLEPVYQAHGEWGKLVAVHEVQVQKEEDPLRKVELLHRVGELQEMNLDNGSAAFDAYGRALAFDAQNEDTLSNLERLAEFTNRWPDATSLYDNAISKLQEERPEDVVDLALRTAQIYEVQLGDAENAMSRYAMVVEQDPLHIQAIESLDRLYEGTQKWPELAAILEKEIEVAATADDALNLQFRLAQVRQNNLGDTEGAIRQYNEILSAAPEHSPTVSALEFLFADGRRPLEVGEVLEPVYQMQENWDALLNLHEQRLQYQPVLEERVSVMHQITEVAEHQAGDHERAFLWIQRAVLEDPTHDHSVLEAERLCGMLDRWPQLASTYADSLDRTESTQAKTDVGKRLARIYQEELGDVARAEEAFRYVYSYGEPDEDTLLALDAIYVQNGSHEALATVLRRQFETADDPMDKAEFGHRLGQVLSNDLGRDEEAIAVYNQILTNIEPDHAESIKALQNTYTKMGNWNALAKAFDQELEVALGDTEQSEILSKMARLASVQQSNPEQAIELWKRVLELRGEDPEALNALGDLYAEHERWGDVVEVLEREVVSVDSDETRVQIYADLGRLWYTKLERTRNALDSYERILDIDPMNTEALFRMASIYRDGAQNQELVDTLHRVIDVGEENLPKSRLDTTFMELGDLYRDKLDRPMDAVDSYNRALEANPQNMTAVDNLEAIHTAEENWVDVIDAMEKRVVAYGHPMQKVAELQRVAEMWKEKANNADGGTSAYERMLEYEPRNEVAFTQLEKLHAKAGRWAELTDMYITRFENAATEKEQIVNLRKAAGVLQNEMGDAEQAFDTLSVAWQMDYTDKDTWMQLEGATRETGRWNELLQAAQEAMRHTQDKNVKISLCLQCARWYGQELGHPEHAIPFYEQIRALDPTNVEAMVSTADLYETTQQYDELAQTLGAIVELTDSPEIRANTFVRMGDLSKGHFGQPEEAPRYYRQALDAHPTNLRAIEALERVYRNVGDDEKLLDILRRKTKAVETPEAIVDANLQLASTFESGGQTQEAISTYERVVEVDDENLLALRGLERLYRDSERWQDLLDVLQKQLRLVETERERVDVHMQLASLWEEQFIKADEASSHLEKVLEINANHSEALTSLARLYRQQQRWDEVIETYERHVDATPDRAEKVRVYKELGDTYAKDLDNADRAVDAYLSVLDIDDTDVEALDALTRIYDKRGDYVSALDTMDQLARLVDSPDQQVDLLFRSGRILDNELGDRASALDKYQRALDINPGHLGSLAEMRNINLDTGDYLAAAKVLELEAQYHQSPRVVAERLAELGRLYDERLDEHGRAIQTFEAALKQDPDNEDAALPLSEEYVQTERFGEAFPLLEMLVKRSQKRDPDEQHRLAFSFGETAMKLGRTDDAIKAFERAYQVDSTHLPTLFGVAGAFFAAKNWDKAFKYYQMLLMHHRDSLGVDEVTDIFYRLGVVKREQNERRKALNMFDKALEEDPHHHPTLDAVVDLYEQQREWQQVIHFLKQKLETTDEFDERFNLLGRIGDLWKDQVGNVPKAIEAYQEASTIKPEAHQMLHKLLQSYQSTKQWLEATHIIGQISILEDRKDRKAKYAYTIGVIVRDELKDADGALEKFNEALDLDSSHLKAFEAINKLLTTKKDWKGLERAYRKMIHRIIQEEGKDDLKFNLFHQLGIIYRDRQQNFDAAAEAFRTSTNYKPASAQQHQILAELYTAMPERTSDAIAEHQWLLKNDPNRVASYRALYRLYFDERSYDKAWCLASTLAFLGKADNEQTEFFQNYRPQGPIQPRGRLQKVHWFNNLLHPDEDRYVSKMMELLAPSVLAVKAASDKALNINKLKPVEPASSTVALARMFGFVQQVLSIPTQPRLFLQEQTPGGLTHIPGSNPPAVLAGGTLLGSGYTPVDLTFVCGRFLSYYLSEHFVRTLFSSHSELRMLLLAALRIGGVGQPDPQVDAWAQQLGQYMQPAASDGLRSVCRKFVDAGGSTDIKRWMQTVELSAVRAGFLVCGDLSVAQKMLQAIGPAGSTDLPAGDKLKELVLFSVSEDYFQLREALGIQIRV